MKIIEIRTTPLALPFKESYHWAGRVDSEALPILVEVKTDEGIVGIGECSVTLPPLAVLNSLREASSLLIGQSPFDIEQLVVKTLFWISLNEVPRYANMIMSGLELALWDLIGKAVGRPVYQLLGGAYRQKVDYFAFLQGDTADELAEHAELAVAAGYSVFYMKVGRGDEKDLENVSAVRQVIGDRRLRVDANQAWDPSTAIRMINRLARFELEFVEQPTTGQSIQALKQVKDAVPVAIAADQSVFTLGDVFEVCRQRAADVIVLSPHEAGGLLAFKKAAAVAEAAGIPICLHGRFTTGVTDCAQHQVGLTLSNLTDGNQIMHQLLVEDIISEPDITPRNGKIGLLERPGLGFELDWDVVGRAAERYRSLYSVNHT